MNRILDTTLFIVGMLIVVGGIWVAMYNDTRPPMTNQDLVIEKLLKEAENEPPLLEDLQLD